MIFQQYRGHLLVVRQPDHGVQTGLFARHWGNEEMPPFTPREPVIAAGTRHDDGWQAWRRSTRPSIHPRGTPWQFYTLTPHEHVPLYRRGIAMAAEHDPTTGLLVSMHGAGLYNDRYGTFRLAERQFNPAEQVLVDEFLAEQALFQQSLAERALGRQFHTHVTTDPQVWYTYLLLQVWDRLSCSTPSGWRRTGTSPRSRTRTGRPPRCTVGTPATCPSGLPRIRSHSRRARSRSRRASCRTGRTAPPKRSWPPWRGPGDGVGVPGEPRLSVDALIGFRGSYAPTLSKHRHATTPCPWNPTRACPLRQQEEA